MIETRVALVTGASRGMGRSIAVALAEQGHDVGINFSRSRDDAEETARLVIEQGRRPLLLQADVSDEQAVRAMIATHTSEFGQLDLLVNNAGTTLDTEPDDLEGLQLEDWDRVFAVNVRGLFQVTRAAVPLLRNSSAASVVNMASIAGLRPSAQPFPYAASKAAVVNLTKTLARALAPEIRVNAVAPGWVEGEWMEHALGENYQRLMERRASHTPMRQVVTPEDVAEVVLSLVLTSRLVTGEVVVIDGGYSAST
ncbi:MAG TPA: SDR family NAD(P)-dependent oxidoreductase [Candidatus Micrarchaeaceae archaeon]|nr:SDR family NAD(P)-dependent oxidoreductase [Candidatus Micrarchaeaceae archaeon]